jgi:hypothetical protein
MLEKLSQMHGSRAQDADGEIEECNFDLKRIARSRGRRAF